MVLKPFVLFYFWQSFGENIDNLVNLSLATILTQSSPPWTAVHSGREWGYKLWVKNIISKYIRALSSTASSCTDLENARFWIRSKNIWMHVFCTFLSIFLLQQFWHNHLQRELQYTLVEEVDINPEWKKIYFKIIPKDTSKISSINKIIFCIFAQSSGTVGFWVLTIWQNGKKICCS